MKSDEIEKSSTTKTRRIFKYILLALLVAAFLFALKFVFKNFTSGRMIASGSVLIGEVR